MLVRRGSYAESNQEIDLFQFFREWLGDFSGGLGFASWQSSLMMSDDKRLDPTWFRNIPNPLIGSHDRLRQWNGKRNDLHDGAILFPALQEEYRQDRKRRALMNWLSKQLFSSKSQQFCEHVGLSGGVGFLDLMVLTESGTFGDTVDAYHFIHSIVEGGNAK